jgi:uncharacterized Zn-finger protein
MNSLTNHQNSPLETVQVSSKQVSCQGSKGASTHPLVYLNMGKNDSITCPYCSRFFTIKQQSNPVIIGLKSQIKNEEHE